MAASVPPADVTGKKEWFVVDAMLGPRIMGGVRVEFLLFLRVEMSVK